MGAFDNMFSASRGRAYALVEEDTVIGAIGFTSAGVLWALSTPFTRGQRWELFTRTGDILKRLMAEAKERRALLEGCPFFHNLIHAKNKPALRWMDKTNLFFIDRDNPVEVGAEVFYNFRTKMDHELVAPRMAVCVPL